MKVIFFGLGSIGSRHLRNLRSIFEKDNVEIEVHAFRNHRKSNKNYPGIKNIYSLEEADNDYDIAFITNPTSLHFETLQNIKGRATWYFVEKPLFNYIHSIENFQNINNYYIASPLRYKRVMEATKEIIKTKKIHHVRVICSSYLPEWRNEDYRISYSANSKLGGGIELDCIHELDYVIHLFGFPKSVKSFIAKVSELEITSNDTANYLLEYENKFVEIHVNYFGTPSQRKMELITEGETYEIDFINNSILSYSDDRMVSYDEDTNDMYVKELEYFLKTVLSGEANHNNLIHAHNVLKIAKGE